MTKISWTGFNKKSREEKIDFLEKHQLLTQEQLTALKKNQQLSLETAQTLVENVLGTFSLPLAIAPDFLIDGKTYHIPMVTEEPSVVAAASFAAKLIKRYGGFTTTVHQRQMLGQITLYGISDMVKAEKNILAHEADLLQTANEAHPSIVKRGGGARKISVEIPSQDFLVVTLHVDTQEAMGANMVNTMAESLKQPLETLTKGNCLMAILSNYATDSLVTAQCELDSRILSRDPNEAHQLAHKLALASQLAQVDPYRASTHNKGIFNGIDALVLATGNDWRAIEAGGHAYASRDGHYKGLATWHYDSEKKRLLGQLTLPMPIGTKGGSIGLNPGSQIAMDLLGQPTAKELATLIVSLGLAQNFAALKALTSTGIQAGHMKLQAKSLLLSAGASEIEVTQLLDQLLASKNLNLATAQALLEKLRN